MADFYENKQVTEEVIHCGCWLWEETSVTDESLDELEELGEDSRGSDCREIASRIER